MARLLLILALVAVVFWVFSVVDCAVQPLGRHRGVSKGMWVAIVIVFPVLGGILWFTVGRIGGRADRVVAPDDDPEFLRRIGTPHRSSRPDHRSRADQDERIRQLEQELAKLDDDDDPPSGPRRGH